MEVRDGILVAGMLSDKVYDSSSGAAMAVTATVSTMTLKSPVVYRINEI